MNIKDLIKKRGFTVAQVAELMPNSRTGGTGISKQSMSLIISGNPQLDTLRNIARIIGCKVGDFFADEQTVSNARSATCPHCGKPITINITPE